MGNCLHLIDLSFKHTRQKKQVCVFQTRVRMELHVIYNSQQMVTLEMVILVNLVQAGILVLIVKFHHVSEGHIIITFMRCYIYYVLFYFPRDIFFFKYEKNIVRSLLLILKASLTVCSLPKK